MIRVVTLVCKANNASPFKLDFKDEEYHKFYHRKEIPNLFNLNGTSL